MKRQVFVQLSVALLVVILVLCIHPLIGAAKADIFGTDANSFEIEFVPIGNPGNPPDTTGMPNPAGAVPYRYRIGKYEISEQMIDKANALGGLEITLQGRGPDKPATVNWFEAARFVNWLNESKGHTPAYKFDDLGNFQLWEEDDPGYNPNNLYRNREAFYFLPSLDEWHKAAYYDPVANTYYDYPTGSDSVPDGIDFPGDLIFDVVFNDGGNNLGPNEITNVGVLSPYGTAGQGGNVSEWEETAFDRINNIAGEHRGLRWGNWGYESSLLLAANNGVGTPPTFKGNFIGLRVAAIPEPCSLWLCLIGLLGLLRMIGRRGYT